MCYNLEPPQIDDKLGRDVIEGISAIPALKFGQESYSVIFLKNRTPKIKSLVSSRLKASAGIAAGFRFIYRIMNFLV